MSAGALDVTGGLVLMQRSFAGREFRVWLGPSCCVLALAGLLFLATEAGATAPSFVWSGGSKVVSESSFDWSLAANWSSGTAPTAGQPVGTLTFPQLRSECESETPSDACYFSFNDLPGLEVEAMQIDNGDDYVIGGERVDLGSGGLTATPAGGSVGPSGDVLETPFDLTETQEWTIAGRGTLVNEAGLLLEGNVSGVGHALNVEMNEEPALYLAGDDFDTGPLSFTGANPAQAAVFNGVVLLLGASLNASSGEPVKFGHVFAVGTGSVGALETDGAELSVGDPGGRIEASSATFDSATDIEFAVAGAGTAPAVYSQLVSQGAVELGGAKLEVVVRPPKQGSACPDLVRGATYTFVSTKGQLSGAFSNASEAGAELPVRFAQACTKESRTIRIHYNESGGTQTVTGTVEQDAFTREEEHRVQEEATKRKTEEEATKLRTEEEASRRKAEEEATKRTEEELVAKLKAISEASAKRMAEEENVRRKSEEAAALASTGSSASKQGSLGSTTESAIPVARLLSSSLSASTSGEVRLKISCPTGEIRCKGTLILKSISSKVGKFNISGGRSATVVVRLSSRARLQLGHKGLLHARAVLVTHDPDGATHTGTFLVTIHSSRTKHVRR